MEAINRLITKETASYLRWWITFGVLRGAMQVVTAPTDQYWNVKLTQILWGALSSLPCFLAFIVLQTKFNKRRTLGRSWLFVFLSMGIGAVLSYILISMIYGVSE